MNSSNQNQNSTQNQSQNSSQSQNQNKNQNQSQKNKNSNEGDRNQNQTNKVQAVQGQMNQSDKRFWTIVASSIVVIAIIAWGIYHNQANAPIEPSDTTGDDSMASTSAVADMSEATSSALEAASSDATYTYSCDNEKNISATFHLPKDDFANVNLSDGRHLILAHAISADGARYTNANQSVVFWTRGVSAFVEDNGTTTYSGCIANRFP